MLKKSSGLKGPGGGWGGGGSLDREIDHGALFLFWLEDFLGTGFWNICAHVKLFRILCGSREMGGVETNNMELTTVELFTLADLESRCLICLPNSISI